MKPLDRIILSLDTTDAEYANRMIEEYSERIYGFKLNHLLFNQHTLNWFPYDHSTKNFPTLVDYKLFDIPNTMTHILMDLIDRGVDMVTVHMSNSRESLDILADYTDQIKICGVTLLTSWTDLDCQLRYGKSPAELYAESIADMEKYGFWGMICAPTDLQYAQMANTSLKKICPGIRPNTSIATLISTDDQVRIMTPEQAIEAGADYLVMGRSFYEYVND